MNIIDIRTVVITKKDDKYVTYAQLNYTCLPDEAEMFGLVVGGEKEGVVTTI